MDFAELYHFLFETIEGIGCLIVACLVLTTIIAAILEYRTQNLQRSRGEGYRYGIFRRGIAPRPNAERFSNYPPTWVA